ncbi:uncharacterized protein LOC144124285 [Amblyomma americanum]
MGDSGTDEDEFRDAETSFTSAQSQSSGSDKGDRLMTLMNVTLFNASLIEQAKTEPRVNEAGGGRQQAQNPGVNIITVPMTTTLIRVTLLGFALYQSKFLRMFACLVFLGVFLLSVWLLTRQADVESTSATPTARATTTFAPFEPSDTPPDAANKTLLLVDIDALSLIGDMTVSNHVLDIDSFPD